MATAIIMPKFEMAQESGTIARWLKGVGERVGKGEPVLEVETDKITMEVESPAEGILTQILAEAGAVVPIGQPIAYVARPDEVTDRPASPASPASSASVRPKATPIAEKMAAEHGIELSQIQGTGRDGQITRQDVEAFLQRASAPAASAPATSAPAADRSAVLPQPAASVPAAAPAAAPAAVPAARRLARELGVNLAEVQGSGPSGRIQSSDVERVAAMARETVMPAAQHQPARVKAAPVEATPPLAPSTAPAVWRTVPLTGIRRTIAQRMSHSMREAPQFNVSVDVNMRRAMAVVEDWRSTSGEGQPKVTLTALLVKVCAWALARHPALNAGYENEAIVEWRDINIGVAVAMNEGLIVPVIRAADRLSLLEIAARLNELAGRARSGQLQLADVQGGTFTLSNLGMFAVDRFTAIVNPPQAAILAVGRAARRVIVDAHGKPRVAPMATLTVSADHRVVDGAQVGQFLGDLQTGLERPGMLL